MGNALDIHVAAALDPEVKDSRQQAWVASYNWNDILSIIRQQYPDRKFIDNLPRVSKFSITNDFTQSLALLKKWEDQIGWRPLKQTIRDGMKGF
jgi:hypothetical protein